MPAMLVADGPRRKKLVAVKRKMIGSEASRWSESFLDYLRTECHLADNTLIAYRRDLKRFRTWLGTRDIRQLRIQELSEYASFLNQEQLAPPSVSRHLVSLKVFFRYLQLEGILSENIAELLGAQKLWERVPKVMSAEMVAHFLQAPRKRDTWAIRDRALLELMYATGCRASEVSDMKVRDLRLSEKFCMCHGKGDKQRMVPLNDTAVSRIQLYLEQQRPQLAAARAGAPRMADAFAARPPPEAGSDLGNRQEIRPPSRCADQREPPYAAA